MPGTPGENPTNGNTYKDIVRDLTEGSTVNLDEFDSKSRELLDQLADVAVTFDPTVEDNDGIDMGSLDSVADSFRKYVANLIVEEGRNESTLELIAKLYKVDSDMRVNLLRLCMDCDKCLEECDTQAVVDKFTEIVNSSEETGNVVDAIVAFYSGDLGNALKVYYEHLNGACPKSSPHEQNYHNSEPDSTIECDHNAQAGEVRLEIVKSTKEHITDVAKIAAGVLAALAVDRLIRRKT